MLNAILRFISHLWYGSADDSTKMDRSLRSPKWPTVRKEHLAKEPRCQWCGTKWALEIHHVQPFHLHPEKELDENNLLTLCEFPGRVCHFKRGHLGNFRNYNPTIREDCDKRRKYEKEK